MTRLGGIARWAVCLAVVCGTAGCYGYAALDVPPPVGTVVRVAVSDQEALRLSDQTGQIAKTYDGRLMGVSNDSVSLSVVTLRVASEFTGSETFRQTLTISRDQLDELSGRELSKWRTGVVALLTAAAAYVVVDRIQQEVGGNTGDDDGGDPPGVLVPGWFRQGPRS